MKRAIRPRSAVLLGVLFLVAGASPGQPQVDLDSSFDVYEVKAEFLERVTRFVTWPDGHWLDQTTPFQIGVWGDCPLNEVLARRSRRWLIQGRPVELRRIAEGEDLSQVDVIFIAGSESDNLERILQLTRGLPILTISDSPGFGARGVLINFFVENESVRFEINQQAVEGSGLELSSRLLKIGHLIGSDGSLPRPSPVFD